MKKPVKKPKNKGEGVMLREKRGFTIVELLVVIAIILILAAFVTPVVSRARAKATECVNNVRQGAMAQIMYAQDHNDTTTALWADLLGDYCDATIQSCPKAGNYTLTAVNLDPVAVCIVGAAANHPTFPTWFSEGTTDGRAVWKE